MVTSEKVSYKCGKCGKIVEVEAPTDRLSGIIGLLPGIRCPYCGYRVLYKIRTPTARSIKAI